MSKTKQGQILKEDWRSVLFIDNLFNGNIEVVPDYEQENKLTLILESKPSIVAKDLHSFEIILSQPRVTNKSVTFDAIIYGISKTIATHRITYEINLTIIGMCTWSGSQS